MRGMDYETLMKLYETPLKAAIAIGFCKADAGILRKRRAGARVGMWRYNGIPAKFQSKLEKMHQDEAAAAIS